MVFTKHARWHVGVTTALSRSGTLRAAVFVLTPHDRRFVEFREYLRPEVRREYCARTVLQLYEEEVWYRRPRVLICRNAELAALVRPDAPERLKVRTNRNARKFETADGIFERHVKRTSRRSQWSVSRRVALKK